MSWRRWLFGSPVPAEDDFTRREAHWAVIEASIRTAPEEWQVYSQWAINPARLLAVHIGGGEGQLFVDTNGPELGGREMPPLQWCKAIWSAIEELKAERLVNRFRGGRDSYTPESIAAWLDDRARLMMHTDAGISGDLAMCATAIRDGKLGPHGMHADEPCLQEQRA